MLTSRRGVVIAGALAVLAALSACSSPPSEPWGLTHAQAEAIRKDIRDEVTRAYDLSRPHIARNMLSLYPDSGRIISAAGGKIVTTRDSLAAGIHYFWDNVGRYMQKPTWIWKQMIIDVLSPDAAVMTATYHVPHHTPTGQPHDIGGAWTAVFVRQGARWVIIQEHLSDLPAPPPAK
ncbi:MAG TPA: nuclear transport factor 2 family protein [Gemmatimonadaceae bacterium]|nr:nuclear transport factor 2 family protein [Gemmatimonadaceae bacterium]